jgi:hypothetical protein
MSNTGKKLREELETEFACLKEFGVTDEELEALYEQCGLKTSRRTLVLNTGRARPQQEKP